MIIGNSFVIIMAKLCSFFFFNLYSNDENLSVGASRG